MKLTKSNGKFKFKMLAHTQIAKCMQNINIKLYEIKRKKNKQKYILFVCHLCLHLCRFWKEKKSTYIFGRWRHGRQMSKKINFSFCVLNFWIYVYVYSWYPQGSQFGWLDLVIPIGYFLFCIFFSFLIFKNHVNLNQGLYKSTRRRFVFTENRQRLQNTRQKIRAYMNK